MTDINLNAATYEQIVTLLSQLATNYSNLAGTFYDVFYSNVAQDVSFKMFDDSGVLKDFTVKNLAKSNEYKITGNGNPNGNIAATMGTTYQDLDSGDLYIKTTNSDSNQGWEYFIKGSFFNNYLRQGTENPNDNVSAPVGTLYVNTNTATLYICIDKDNSKWAPVSSSFLEFADRDLSNITDNGKKVIDDEIKGELGTKAETITEDTRTNDYIPTALAVSQYVDPRFNTKQDKSNMASVLEDSTTTYPNSRVVYDAVSELSNEVDTKQDKSNLVTVLSEESTDAQYPSAKCMYDLVGNLEDIINAL